MREKATSLITSTAMLSGVRCPAKFLWAQHCPWGITGNPYEFWILPVLSISPFLCPLQSQNPKVTFRKPESTFHSFLCSKSHVGKGWHEWLMQPGETQLPSLGSAWGSHLAHPKVQRFPKLGNKIPPTALNVLSAPSVSQIITRLQYFPRNT